MWEENQNIVQNTWTTETEQSPIRFLADSLQSRKDSIRQNVNATSTQQNQAELENLYEKSMTSNNVDTCRGYDFECRKWEFAFYLKQKGKEAWRNTEWIANDDLLDSYIWNTENPQLTYNIMKDYIMHPEETDIKPYLVRLWWMEPTGLLKTSIEHSNYSENELGISLHEHERNLIECLELKKQ